jgi:hypothetical protein
MTVQVAVYRYLINPIMRGLLNSPLHGILSDNIAILNFQGRKSGRKLSTPLSYTREDDLVRLLSSQNTHWWRNFRGSDAPVELEIGRKKYSGTAHLLEGDSEELRESVKRFITALPRDARVYGIKLDGNKAPVEASIAAEAPRLKVVEVRLD